MRMWLVLFTAFGAMAMMAGEEKGVVWSAATGGTVGGYTANTTREIAEVDGKKAMKIVMTGEKWSGTICNWYNFNPGEKGIDPATVTHLVVRLKALAKPKGDLLVQVAGADAKKENVKFVMVKNYDEGKFQKQEWFDLKIPILDCAKDGKPASLGSGITQVHFGAFSREGEKDIQFAVAKISLVKEKAE